MALALFDLDNTLIAGDSDHLWGEFLVTQGLVNAEEFRHNNDRFYQQYQNGTLNIEELLGFCLEPLTHHSLETLAQFHQKFMEDVIRPIILDKAMTLLEKHRNQGDHLMIITATNHFVAAPIASAMKVDGLLAIDLEIKNNRYTGRTIGTPTFQDGKITRLKEWLSHHPHHSMEGSYFYSDSHNDLPLLNAVEHPHAVDADPQLTEVAKKSGWPIISLR